VRGAAVMAEPTLHGYDCNNLKKVRQFVENRGDVNKPVVGFLGQQLPPLHWCAPRALCA